MMVDLSKLMDRVRGCLVSGAVGDAMGYPIEFMDLDRIISDFGTDGLDHLLLREGKARISDDTQMTMYVACGYLDPRYENDLPKGAFDACRRWASYQRHHEPSGEKYWIEDIRGINERRAPGNACMDSLMNLKEPATMIEPFNDSKGCGGLMRVAPAGIIGGYTKDEKIMIGIRTAASTHGHPLGYLTAAAMVGMIHRLLYEDDDLEEAVLGSMDDVRELITGEDCCDFPKDIFDHYLRMRELLMEAIELAHSDEDEFKAKEKLGEGWVSEETLALAVYSCLRFSNYRDVLRCAVSLTGDSDSIGSVAGNIIGSHLGYEKLRDEFDLNCLECHGGLIRLADELCSLRLCYRKI